MSSPKTATTPTRRSRTSRSETLRFAGVFLAAFAVLDGVFLELVTGTDPYRSYLVGLARLCASVLGAIGQDVARSDAVLSGSDGAVEVAEGCDAIQPWLLFVCAVLALRTSPLRSVAVVLLGTAASFAVNVVRIVSLFLIQARTPELFDTMHFAVWPLILVVAVVLMRIGSASWCLRSRTSARA